MNPRHFWADRILPITQLLICAVAMWPARHQLFSHSVLSINLYLFQQSNTSADGGLNFLLPILPSDDREAESTARAAHVALTLNCPVLLVQMPYVLLNPDKKEWVPLGMDLDSWRALSWPVLGLAFWWLANRGIRALVGFGRAVSSPRVGVPETVVAVILLVAGVTAAVGIATSTVADRRDITFFYFLLGWCLWGVLACATLTARLLQWQERKRVYRTDGTVA